MKAVNQYVKIYLLAAITLLAYSPRMLLADSSGENHLASSLTYIQDASGISIRHNKSNIFIDKEGVSANVIDAASNDRVTVSLIGIEYAGTCCPWRRVIAVEIRDNKATVHDTKIYAYLNDSPTITPQKSGFIIKINSAVNEPVGPITLSLKEGKLTKVASNEKPATKGFCTDLYNIYKMECLPERGPSCDDPALLRFAEINSLAKKSLYDTDEFFNACSKACTDGKLSSLEEFSSSACKSK